MTGEEYLVNEIKKYRCVCFYPSAGTDLSDIDFFGSGKKLMGERLDEKSNEADFEAISADCQNDPDLFIHADLNFYSEFEEGFNSLPTDYNINGSFKVVGFRELPLINDPNLIHDNYVFSGKCFEYKLQVWGRKEPVTLIICLCENEAVVSKIFLAHQLKLDFIWSKNWNGSKTRGTWMANTLERLQTAKVYTDWLCIPGFKGEPRNEWVEEKYPELMEKSEVKMVRNNDIHWIDESAHGWVEEFIVKK